VKRMTTRNSIGFKHFVDGSYSVKTVPDDQNSNRFLTNFVDGSCSVKRVPDDHFSNRF
jgi:hypothetical protein